MTAYTKIRKAMRRNEVQLLAHIRKHGGLYAISLLGKAWMNAFFRLQDAGMIRHSKGWYMLVSGARPVTGAVR